MNLPGVATLQAMGLPVDATYLSLRFRPEGSVEVVVAYTPTHDQAQALAEVWHRYEVTVTPKPI